MVNRRTALILIFVIVFALASFAMILAVSNRPTPEEAVAGEPAADQLPADPALEPAADEAAGPDPIRVTNNVPVNGVEIAIAPLNTEEVELLPEGEVQPVINEQPVVETPPEQPAEQQPAEEVPAEQPAPTQVPAEEPPPAEPTPAPTAVPDVQPAPVGNAQRNTAVPQFILVPYTVVAGDTMYSLSQRPEYNTTVDFMQCNGLETDNMIANEVVNIPVVNPDFCINSTPHIIREKDNLFRLAINNGTDVPTLSTLNGITDPTQLKIGELLCIP